MTARDIILSASGASSEPADDYFKNVSLLLTGDGTNGAQNNTFLDSSSNAFTVTRYGNTTQGTFSPYGNLWSNYFDGVGDYVATPNTSAGIIGSSSTYSVEFWINFNTVTDSKFIGGSEGRWWFAIGWNGITSNKIGINVYSSGGGWQPLSSTTTPVVGVWYHVAFTYDNGAVKLYINGVQEASSTGFSVNSSFNTPICVGGAAPAASEGTNCFISNFRVIKGGSLVYTGNFTPSTTPLTATTETVLLTSQSNRFIDNSSNNFTLTRNGDTRVTRFSPFNPTAPYSASTIGGSGYFDGTGDYLAVTNNTALAPGAGNFTFECWMYQPEALFYGNLWTTEDVSSGFQTTGIRLTTGPNNTTINVGGRNFSTYSVHRTRKFWLLEPFSYSS